MSEIYSNALSTTSTCVTKNDWANKHIESDFVMINITDLVIDDFIDQISHLERENQMLKDQLSMKRKKHLIESYIVPIVGMAGIDGICSLAKFALKFYISL